MSTSSKSALAPFLILKANAPRHAPAETSPTFLVADRNPLPGWQAVEGPAAFAIWP